MAAPKNPNTTAAAAKRRQMGNLTASNRLVEEGYLVLKPEELEKLPASLKDSLIIELEKLGFSNYSQALAKHLHTA